MAQIQKQHSHDRQEEVAIEEPRTKSHDDLKHELDELLDEIDSVLAENVEEFVTTFVQRGGE
jgi:ubiquitin-like protein Pup